MSGRVLPLSIKSIYCGSSLSSTSRIHPDLVFFLDDAKDTGSEDEAERHKIRRKYWEKALPLIQKTTGSFQNANPQKNNAVYGGTNNRAF